jgi:voltage-gated potassium channel
MLLFVFWLGLTAHWLACGWLALTGPFDVNDKWGSYIHSLYWCVTTLTTVGYGDVTPITKVQEIYTMLVMILGVGMYGYVIGNVATLLANIDMARAQYLSNMERLSTFMKYRDIPSNLQRRIYEYYSYLWEHRLGFDESAVLSELPGSLQAEVSLVLKGDLITKVPFLRGASHELIRDIAFELHPVVFSPGTWIFQAGEMGRHLYFISHGKVEVIAPDGKTIYTTLEDGDFFGEIALISNQPRTASVRTIDYCDLYTIDRDTFQRILTHYPDFEKHIQEVAQMRQDRST